MAGFFDKVSDVINNTANEISDKAKEISEVSSLNVQIRSQEKIIESTYLEIGKTYYESHKNATEDDLYELISKITAAKETADRLKEEVANIKGK